MTRLSALRLAVAGASFLCFLFSAALFHDAATISPSTVGHVLPVADGCAGVVVLVLALACLGYAVWPRGMR